MKKTFFAILVMGVCSAFSFYKMSDAILHEIQITRIINPSRNPGDLIPLKINHVKVSDNKNFNSNSNYHCYIYNEQLKYGFIGKYNRNEQNLKRFELLKKRTFDRTWWENCFISDQFKKILIYDFKIDSSQISSLEGLNNQIESKMGFDYIPLGMLHPFDNNFKPKSESNIYIHNSKEGVQLSKYRYLHIRINKIGDSINFEKAFKNYVRKHSSSYGEQLFQDVLELKDDLNNPIKKPSFTNILKKSKMTFSEEERDLLESSKILAIWALPSEKYNNKDYIEREKSSNNSDAIVEKPRSKIINPIVIGFAVDKRDNTTFHWVTDLGQDVSVLFDYADELKQSTHSS